MTAIALEFQKYGCTGIGISDLQLYQVIDVTHDRISYQAKTATGRLYDQFEIIKADDGKKKFVSPEETATE